jgi:threonine synthase
VTDTFFTTLLCPECSRSFDPRVIQGYCADCQQPLFAVYDLAAAGKKLDPRRLASRDRSLWRYRELLPVFSVQNIVTLGEGGTPLLSLSRFARRIGSQALYLKEEGSNPTGSFKARGMSVAVSKCRELGVREVAVPSAGNAGGALAAYAAVAGITAHIFIPRDTPVVNREETVALGADVHLVDGLISDAAKAMAVAGAGKGWFDMSTMKEPYRLEGKKTLGYEIAEQLGWKLPDVIFYPTGGGTGLIGMWKAFGEMEELGWAGGKKPRMVAVQMSGCAPIVDAFRRKLPRAEFWQNAATLASGLRVPKAFADKSILQILTDSGGTALAVEDEEILRMIREFAALEGLLLSPEGAATAVAAERLLHEGWLSPAETTVIFNTGSGYKYREVMQKLQIV